MILFWRSTGVGGGQKKIFLGAGVGVIYFLVIWGVG